MQIFSQKFFTFNALLIQTSLLTLVTPALKYIVTPQYFLKLEIIKIINMLLLQLMNLCRKLELYGM